MNTYTSIGPRASAYVLARALKRGQPKMLLGKSGDMITLPSNQTKVVTARRYERAAVLTTALVEGVTPVGQNVVITDVTATLKQWGGFFPFTDVAQDTIDDPILVRMSGLIGEQAAQTYETDKYYTLRAGTNKFYSNGVARTSVNTPMTAGLQKKVVRALNRELADYITEVEASTPDFNTEAVNACYLGYGHIDLENDIRNMAGFIDVKDYGNAKALDGEIGSVGKVRYLLSSLYTPYADAGGAAGAMVTTGGTSADVYPLIIVGRNAWSGVSMKGDSAITPIIVNPTPVAGDELGQRGSAGWKGYHTAFITNDLWMAVVEVAASEL